VGGIAEYLDYFAYAYGGWSDRPVFELFEVHRVATVKPKTYFTDVVIRETQLSVAERRGRTSVITTSDNPKELLEMRDKLFAVGITADERIEAETERLISEFRARERQAARAEIRSLLPHVFQGEA
jgi:hypothetical protein